MMSGCTLRRCSVRSIAALGVLAVTAGPLARPGAGGAGGDGGDPEPRRLQAADLKPLVWRSIGPANMGGRVASVAIAPGNSKTIFVGYATGGLWKSINNGTTFSPVFDEEATSAIGTVIVCDAPPNWPGWADEDGDESLGDAEQGKAKIIWVGTGEGNGRNSSTWGNGVYRSTDGGGSFTHLGLAETHDVPAMAVDPANPDVCFVAALGHLWGANEERGIYKTTDGGKTWRAVLQIDANTGACDVILDPRNSKTVYAAMYARRRTAHSFHGGGPNGGIFRSEDGGESWNKLTNGLPESTGRIGLDVHRANPDIVYAFVESDEGGVIGTPWEKRSRAGGVFRSDDRGDTWVRMSDVSPRPFYFSRIRVDPVDPDRVYLPGWGILLSDDGGRTFRGTGQVMHVDFHTMLIDPDDTDHLLVGNDGGFYVSYDRGKTWEMHNHMAVGQFYNVAVDNSEPYRIGGGLQDNGTWIGPSETITQEAGGFMGRAGSITNAEWQFVMGGDGFHIEFHPEDPNIIYAEWQGGQIGRVHLDTGDFRNLRPSPKEGEPRYRFNWNAPFFISPHDHTVLYLGGNYVFKLTEGGDRWERISEDLSDAELIEIITVGSDAETYGTVVSLAESPLKAGMLWAGTDDGRVHVTTDDGESWEDVTPDEVSDLYVSCIEASRHDHNTAYVAVDGHRSDFFEPIILMTTDAGQSWSSIVGDMPTDAPPETIREDPRNPNVLYVGTEHASYVTIDRGQHWVKLNGKTLPTVPVDDLKIQAREMDLVAGTHGRSIYVLDDISPISQLTDEVVQSTFHVFDPMPGRPRDYLGYGGLWSDRMFIASNPPMGAAITYWIRDYADEDVKISIKNANDVVVRKLNGTNRPGLNRVYWDLQAEAPQKVGNPHELTEFMPAGTYQVTVTHGEESATVDLEVLPRAAEAKE